MDLKTSSRNDAKEKASLFTNKLSIDLQQKKKEVKKKTSVCKRKDLLEEVVKQ